MTSEALDPSWQIGDADVQIGNGSLQLGYKDVNPTANSRRARAVSSPVGGRRPRSVQRLFLPPRRS